MTTPQLAPPPRDVAPRATRPGARAPPSLPGLRGHARTRAGKALRWALLLSVAVHAALLLLVGDFVVDPSASPETMARRTESVAGLEWVVPVPEGAEGDSPPAASEAEPAEAAPRELPRVLRATPGEPAPEPAAAVPAAGGAAEGRGSARDALRPGYQDPRLYVDPDALGVRGEAPSSHEKYMEHLQARIDAVNDSMGVVAAREKAAKDWTFRDKNGKRWGLSDEGLHLGGITVPPALVPIPRSTGDNQSIEAGREQQRQRDEIRRQEETRVRRDTMEARSQATRERNDARRPGGGG